MLHVQIPMVGYWFFELRNMKKKNINETDTIL